MKQHRSRPCCSPLGHPELSRPRGLGSDTDRPPAPAKPPGRARHSPEPPFPGAHGLIRVAAAPPLGGIPAPPQLHDGPRGASGEPWCNRGPEPGGRGDGPRDVAGCRGVSGTWMRW